MIDLTSICVNAKRLLCCVHTDALTSESSTDTSTKGKDDDHSAHRLPIRRNADEASDQLGHDLVLLLTGEAVDMLRRQRKVRVLRHRGRRRQHVRLPVRKARAMHTSLIPATSRAADVCVGGNLTGVPHLTAPLPMAVVIEAPIGRGSQAYRAGLMRGPLSRCG